MEQTGEYRIAASRDTVWAALNDPGVLARCIDGCQSLEQTADDRFDATVKARVGPVRATFDAELELHDVVPGESYTLHANVKGGAAGFARGHARVHLSDDAGATRLEYTVNANVGGKLAQVGSRLIDGTARKMAEDFFSCFDREVAQTPPMAEETGAPPADVEPAGTAEGTRRYEPAGRWVIWGAAFVALLLAMLFAL